MKRVDSEDRIGQLDEATSQVYSPEAEGYEEFVKNSFVGFIVENPGRITHFCVLSTKLNDLEKAWHEESAEYQELQAANRRMVLGVIDAGGYKRKYLKKIQRRFDQIGGNSRPYTQGILDEIRQRMTPDAKLRFDAIQSKFIEYDARFNQERKPVLEDLLAFKKDLFERFREDLAKFDTFTYLSHFQSFLEDPRDIFVGVRQQINPFLVALAEHVTKNQDRKSLFDEAVREGIEKARENPPLDLVTEFIIKQADLKSNGSTPKPTENGEWIRYLLKWGFPETKEGEHFQDENINQVALALIGSRQDWPRSFNKDYSVFVSFKLQQTLTGVKKALRPYSQEQEPIGLGQELMTLANGTQEESRKKREKVEISVEPEAKEQPPQKEQEKPCAIALLMERPDYPSELKILSKKEAEEFLKKQAKGIARNNPYVVYDGRLMLNYLRVNPRGLGTKQLTHREITIGHDTVPLMSLDPRDIQDPRFNQFKFPQAGKLRMVYAIHTPKPTNGNEPKDVIVLRSFTNHDRYDQQQLSSKS